MRSRLLLPISIAVVALSASANAAVVPVAGPTELRAAVAIAKGGDEIVLAAGTYAISGANIPCSANGTPAAPIVVRSLLPLAAKLELSTTEGFVVTGASWHFEGLDLKGTCPNDADCAHAFHVSGAASDFALRGSRVVDFDAQLKVNASSGGASIPHAGTIEGNELFDTHPRQTTNPVTKLNIDTGDGWIVRANYIHDFHRADGNTSYGAFMKSGGKNGLFERNLVLCTKDDSTAGTHIGLSFGGGGTGGQFCAPAFDANVPCTIEHSGGVMKNNVIARCSDVGIYINRGKNTKVLHNTLIATTGIDFRFETTSGEARGNVVTGVIRSRDTATHTAADNLTGVSQTTFEAMYMAPLIGDLRKKGDLATLIGKGPLNADVPNDYCLRARAGAWDLGALQHSLGDCATTTLPPGASSSSGDGGASSSSGSVGSPGADGGSSSSASSSGASGDTPTGPSAGGDAGCGCRTTPGRDAPLAIGGLVIATVLVTLRRRR